jgi:peptidyl-prolyl cis-trans isomerase C
VRRVCTDSIAILFNHLTAGGELNGEPPLYFFMTIFNKLILTCIVTSTFVANAQSASSSPASTADAAQSAKPTVTQETVLASNATVKVTKADFDAELSRIPETERFEFLLSRTRIATVLENLLINKVLAKEAIEQKLEQNQKVKDEILNQTEKVLAKYRGQQLLQEVKVKDFTAAARETYLTDPKKSIQPARYKPWQVLVSLLGRDKDVARKRAVEARERVLRGDNLEEIAKEYSDDSISKKAGGELDLTVLSEFEISFADALKKMKPGDVSEVIETRYGFHVIYLMEFLPEKKRSFESMKPELIEETRLAYLKSNYDNHLNRIRLDPDLKVNIDALEVIRPRIPENVKPVYTPPDTIKAPPRKVIKP